MNKPASPDYPIMSAIEKRWSPRAFSDQVVSDSDVRRIIEAARWTPSGFNEQPWRFIVGTQGNGDTHEKIASTLLGFNAAWAVKAPVLMIACTATTYHNAPPQFIGQHNGSANYDTGQSVAYMTIQATELGLHSHQMGGFDRDKAREVFAIPEGYSPLVAIAFGYVGDAADLPEELAQREVAPRKRLTQAEFVFSDSWGKSL